MSKKRKNTYTITFNTLINNGMFSNCKQTPMPLITINGQKQDTNTGFIKSKPFPNPCANEMAVHHEQIAKSMGEKIATTIIEYLDKETNKPVIQLYPTTFYIFEDYKKDYLSHLNHATRRNFEYELRKRHQIHNLQFQR